MVRPEENESIEDGTDVGHFVHSFGEDAKQSTVNLGKDSMESS